MINKQVNIHEAKTQLSKLVELAEAGQEIVLARAGKPVARLVPLDQPRVRQSGRLKGMLQISDDFDSPLPDELQRAFEGLGDG